MYANFASDVTLKTLDLTTMETSTVEIQTTLSGDCESSQFYHIKDTVLLVCFGCGTTSAASCSQVDLSQETKEWTSVEVADELASMQHAGKARKGSHELVIVQGQIAYILNGDTLTLTEAASMTDARYNPCVASLNDEDTEFLIIGGYSLTNQNQIKKLSLSAQDNQITDFASMYESLINVACSPFTREQERGVLVVGGQTQSTQEMQVGTTFYFQNGNNVRLDDMPAATVQGFLLKWTDNKTYYFGGSDQALKRYESQEEAWETLSSETEYPLGFAAIIDVE